MREFKRAVGKVVDCDFETFLTIILKRRIQHSKKWGGERFQTGQRPRCIIIETTVNSIKHILYTQRSVFER